MIKSNICKLKVNKVGGLVVCDLDGNEIPYQTDFSIKSDVFDEMISIDGEDGFLLDVTFSAKVFLSKNTLKYD